jgi:hypothetical protein
MVYHYLLGVTLFYPTGGSLVALGFFWFYMVVRLLSVLLGDSLTDAVGSALFTITYSHLPCRFGKWYFLACFHKT